MSSPSSRALVAAALGGLLGCAGSDHGEITSSTTDPAMTLETFRARCAARHGTVELHSHCGGANSCKGMSYDTATHVLIEHTCKATNTCAGYSCVIPG